MATSTYADGGGISYGANESTITGISFPGGQLSISATLLSVVNFSGGTRSNDLTAVVFSNSHNVSFGLDGSTMTASASSPAETPFGISGGTQSVSTGSVVFSNSNNVTFGMSGSSRMTASASFPAETPFGISGGTQSVSTGSVVFSNSNNVTFGMSGSSRMTASASFPAETPFGVSAGSQSVSTGTMVMSNSNGLTFGMSGSSRITASHDGMRSITAGTTHALGPGLSFADGGGVSFGINGSTITATVGAAPAAGIGALTAGGAGITSGTVSFANGSNVSWGINGQTLTASVASSLTAVNISAGTTSQNLSAVVFSNSNGVSFGIDGSTVTASVAPAGGGFSAQAFENLSYNRGLANLSNLTALSERPIFLPFYLPHSMTFHRLIWEMSRSTSGSNSFSVTAGLYTMSNATRMSLLGSVSNSFSATNTASVSGIRQFAITNIPVGMTALTPGSYVLALHFHTLGGTASMNYSIRGGFTTAAPLGLVGAGADQNTTATSALTSVGYPFYGRYSVTSASLPNAVTANQVFVGLSGTQMPIPVWFRLEST